MNEFALRFIRHDFSCPFAHGSRTEIIVPHHIVEAGTNVVECRFLTHRGLDRFGIKALHGHAIFLQFSHEHRSNHFAVVGDTVVERQNLHGAQFDRITVCHFADGHGIVRNLNSRAVCTGNLTVETVAEVHFLELAHELLGITVIGLCDDFRKGNIRADRQGATNRIDRVLRMRIRVLGFTQIHPPVAVHLHRIVQFDLVVIQCRH